MAEALIAWGEAAAFARQDVMQEKDWETAVNAAEKLGGLHGLIYTPASTSHVH